MNKPMCKLGRKAEMGVGTLIVFIAFILVAAIAAGVLIQTAISLQQRALSVGDQAESNIATHVDIIEISGTNGVGGYINNLTEIVRLSSGSDPIKLSDSFVSISTPTSTGNLKYRGTSSTLELGIDGFNTYRNEEIGLIGNTTQVTLKEDYDDDGALDYVKLYSVSNDPLENQTNTSWLQVILSTAGTFNVSLNNAAGTPKSLGNASGASVALSVTSYALTSGSSTYGYVTISGTTATNNTIDANVNVTLAPYNLGGGYYSVEYINQGSNYIEGYLQTGDTIKLYYETPEDVGESTGLRINFIPKVGTSTMIMFQTPDVLSQERVYLYP